MKKMIKKFWWTLLVFPFLLLAGFVLWAEITPAPMPEAATALQNNSSVEVITQPWITFQPEVSPAKTGLIFYPGGRVNPESYAPMARALAEKGFLVVIVPMPLNLAVTAPGKAADVIAAYPEIQTWAIAGHSLGGSMAANFAKNNPAEVDGLALLASYPAASDDLSNQDISVISISGTNDGLSTPEKIEASKALLPPNTQFVAIDGGNHAQFGWYGNQAGDNPATISREDQQNQVIEALSSWLAGLDK